MRGCHKRILCEVNSNPPNLASETVHEIPIFIRVAPAPWRVGRSSLTWRHRSEPAPTDQLSVLIRSWSAISTTIALLAARPWPGNIRELRNVLARFTLAAAHGFVGEVGLDATICQAALTTPGLLKDIQRARILAVHAETTENMSETARRLKKYCLSGTWTKKPR
jgi:hypothetical protein